MFSNLFYFLRLLFAASPALVIGELAWGVLTVLPGQLANHFVDAGKAHSGGSTVLYGLDLYHKMRPLLFRSDLFLAKALRRSNDFLGTFVVFNKV